MWRHSMRAVIAGAVVALVGTGLATAARFGRLTPKVTEETFSPGPPFTAARLANVKFKMVFKAEGTRTREPAGKGGAKSEGTWKLSTDGFCTTWKGSKENC